MFSSTPFQLNTIACNPYKSLHFTIWSFEPDFPFDGARPVIVFFLKGIWLCEFVCVPPIVDRREPYCPRRHLIPDLIFLVDFSLRSVVSDSSPRWRVASPSGHLFLIFLSNLSIPIHIGFVTECYLVTNPSDLVNPIDFLAGFFDPISNLPHVSQVANLSGH